MGCGASTAAVAVPTETVDLQLDSPRRYNSAAGSSSARSPTTELNLSERGLVTVPDLTPHVHLRSLTLDRNKLSQLTLPGVSNTLTELSVAECALTAVDPPALLAVPRVTSLNLSGNDLSSLPATLAKCSQLTRLDLSRNRFSTIPPAVLELVSLRFLAFDSNLLADLPRGLFRLTQLTELRLANNQIVTLTEDFGQLIQLSRCDVSCNKIVALPKSVVQLRSLVFFDTHSNPFTLASLRASVGVVRPTSTSTPSVGSADTRLATLLQTSTCLWGQSGGVLLRG